MAKLVYLSSYLCCVLVQGVYRCSSTCLEQILLSKSSLITSLARCVGIPPLSAPEHHTVTLIALPYLSRRSVVYYYYFSTSLNLKPSQQSTPLTCLRHPPGAACFWSDSQGARRYLGSRGTGSCCFSSPSTFDQRPYNHLDTFTK